jgi:hypothetical protein
VSEAQIVCYGDGDQDGPAFERNCPLCGRFLKFPDRMIWHTSLDDMCKFHPVDCKHCGPVEPKHVGWAGDFA